MFNSEDDYSIEFKYDHLYKSISISFFILILPITFILYSNHNWRFRGWKNKFNSQIR